MLEKKEVAIIMYPKIAFSTTYFSPKYFVIPYLFKGFALSFSKSNNQNKSFFSSKEDVFFIDDCLGYFFCVKHKSLRVGDHMVYFLEVENMEFYTKDPLVWYKGNFENIL